MSTMSSSRCFALSSCARPAANSSRGQLWQLLVQITIRKARTQGRRHTAGVRDVAAEQREATEDLLAAVMDREPGPEEAAILMDQIAAVLKGLPEGYCRVLELRLQGRSAAEIAARLGMVRQTVYRHMTVLKQRMQKNL